MHWRARGRAATRARATGSTSMRPACCVAGWRWPPQASGREPPRYNAAMVVSRDAAWQLLTEWTQSDSLRKHALAVEAAVRGYARRDGENEEEWGVVALL